MPMAVFPFLLVALPQSWQMEAWLGPAASRGVHWTAFSVALAGLLLRCLTVAFAPDGTSSRDTHRLRAPALNTAGAYSLVRHPLYLGNAMMWVGAAASLRVWWLAVVVAFIYWLYIERVMMAEESYLLETFGDDYRQWASTTPAFVPRLAGWRPAAGAVQWRRVLSEHNGLLALAIIFPALKYLEDWQTKGESFAQFGSDHPEFIWPLVVAFAGSTLAIVIRRWGPWAPVTHPAHP